MKSSLEDERRALLEQIEASRAVYRRMLAGETPGSTAPAMHDSDAQAGLSRRDRAIQWVFAHPLQVAAGVALLVLLVPRMAGRSRASHRRREVRQTEKAMPSGGTLRAVLTVAALLLRDPARLRAATAVAASAWRWLLRRRHGGIATMKTPAVAPSARTDARLH